MKAKRAASHDDVSDSNAATGNKGLANEKTTTVTP